MPLIMLIDSLSWVVEEHAVIDRASIDTIDSLDSIEVIEGPVLLIMCIL